MDDYPETVCFDCGRKYGKRIVEGHVCTCYPGTCGVCGQEKIVTEPRDFGHLKPEWRGELIDAQGRGD